MNHLLVYARKMSFLLKFTRPIYQLNQRFNHFIATNLENYRSLISIKGKESTKFLQGLTTNDIHLLNENNRILYSMILNTKVE
jgi:folate-binding Fe-S cluster repair protein YgfZ